MLDHETIAKIALASLPKEAFENQVSASVELAKRATDITRQLSRRSLMMRVLDSVRIPATIETIELEESSQRYLVTFRPDHKREDMPEVETIRTDRIDDEYGAFVKDLWEPLEGKHVLIYKHLEFTNNPERPKVRIAPYAELLEPSQA